MGVVKSHTMRTAAIIITTLLAVLAFSGNSTVSNRNAYTVLADTLNNQSVNDSCEFWITKVTGRRHNRSCSKYMKTNGYCSDKRIGLACKWCGG